MKANVSSLGKNVMELMDLYLSLPLKDIQMCVLLEELVQVLKSHDLWLTQDMSIVIKALITVEGTARMLYPELDVITQAEPHVRKLVSQHYSTGHMWERLKNNLADIWTLQQHLPWSLSTIFKKIERDQLTIGFDHKNLSPFQKTLEVSFKRKTDMTDGNTEFDF